MLVQNKGDYVRNAAGVTLVPGTNEVSDADFKKFSAHPLMKKLIDAGEIVPQKGDSSKDLSAEDAIALVQDTFNIGLLEDWLSSDKRKTVQEAINAQIATIRGTDTDEE